MRFTARALTIAGSDSGGCAGIQADLRTFSALGVHGASAITAITAQNTLGVTAVEVLSLEIVEAQIRAVSEDIGFDVVKTGMIPTAEMVELVADCAERYRMNPLVVDPVMVSTSGARLTDDRAGRMLKELLFPLASVITPNIREAEVLTGLSIRTPGDIEEAARRLLLHGPMAVILTGGDANDLLAVDYFADNSGISRLKSERIKTRNTHGSGCTFASATAAFMAHGLEVREAAARAKEFVHGAIQASYSVGKGPGPLGHFYRFRE